MAWTSGRLSGGDVACVPSSRAGAVEAVLPDAGGVASPDVPLGGLPDGAGVFGGALAGGATPDCDGAPLVPAGGVAPGVSTLPRMIGRPSLPLPMTTILEFGDNASCSVASMPRQRR